MKNSLQEVPGTTDGMLRGNDAGQGVEHLEQYH